MRLGKGGFDGGGVEAVTSGEWLNGRETEREW